MIPCNIKREGERSLVILEESGDHSLVKSDNVWGPGSVRLLHDLDKDVEHGVYKQTDEARQEHLVEHPRETGRLRHGRACQGLGSKLPPCDSEGHLRVLYRIQPGTMVLRKSLRWGIF